MNLANTTGERSGIITLLTDFGHADEYVGVVKGVLLSHFAAGVIVDLCHSVARQDIAQAARMLEASIPYFPGGTVHLVVVDPGVGTNRPILIAEAADQLFVGPDNGVLTTVLQSGSCRCWRLHMENNEGISATFHGRDVMAPAAARLAAGMAPEKLGSAVAAADCILIRLPAARFEDDRVIGEVTGFDHFGNIATSISKELLNRLTAPLSIRIAGKTIDSLSRTYQDVPRHGLLALIDSRGYLEIGMNEGDAADHLACRRGDAVIVTAAD